MISLRWLTETDAKIQKVLKLYNSVLTNDDNGLERTIPGSKEGNVRHQHPDSSVKDTEYSSVAKTDKTSKIDKGKLGEHIPVSLVY